MPPTPQSNVEKYLSVIAGHGGEIPSEPSSRVEYYLDKIVKNGGIGGKLKPEIVSSLPAIGESGVLYLIHKQGASGQNVYDEYIWIEDNSKYELLGQTDFDIDLSEYVKNTRKVGNVPLSADIPVTLTGDSAITVTNTGTASVIGYSIAHDDSGVTAGSKGDTTNQTPDFGDTFKVLSATVDTKGHVAALGDHTVKVPDTEATQSAKGLMSASDKTKLDTLIDATLSNEGKAADAKATGDSLSAFRELLRRMEIHCTASGNPATFSDADAANVKALSVTITPTQSGSGDPYPPGGGKNLLNITAESANINGIAFTVNRDAGGNVYSITASGTATADAIFYTGDSLSLTDGDYILSGCPNGGGWTEYCLIFGNVSNYGGDTSFSARTQRLCIKVGSGQTVNGLTFYPMIRRASDTDPTFAPYSNVRPISGVSSVSVTRTGENGANPQSVTVTLTDGGNPLTVYGGTLNVTTGELTVTMVSKNLDTIVNSLGWAASASYPGGFYIGYGSNPLNGKPRSQILCSHAKTVLDLDDYKKGTCYSDGSLNCRLMEAGATLEEWRAYIQSEKDAGRPIQVVYELLTPVTYQLTPQQLATLSGYNAVSTDAGTLSVTYRADTTLVL